MTDQNSARTLGLTEPQVDAVVAALDHSSPAPKYQSSEHLRWLEASPAPSEAISAVVPTAPAGPEPSSLVAGHAAGIVFKLGSGERVGLLANLFPNPPKSDTGLAVAHLTERAAEEEVVGILALATRTELPALEPNAGWKRVRTLRTRVLFPRPRSSSQFKHARVTETFLASQECRMLLESITTAAPAPTERTWSVEELLWRLASPHGRYLLSWTDTLVVVSIRRTGVIPMGLILKCWVRGTAASTANTRVRTQGLFGAIARFHGTPLLGYRGANVSVRVGGVPVPRPNRRSAKFLLAWSPAGRANSETSNRALDLARAGTFELLDSDAY